nr:hypothetical protein [Calothrix sp. MO_167.B12]
YHSDAVPLLLYTPRGLKPHPLRVVCFVLGFKSPLQNVITNYELRITNCLIVPFFFENGIAWFYCSQI